MTLHKLEGDRMMAYHLQNLIAIPILFLMIFYLILLYAQKIMKIVVIVE
jgi:hypothetical protein